MPIRPTCETPPYVSGSRDRYDTARAWWALSRHRWEDHAIDPNDALGWISLGVDTVDAAVDAISAGYVTPWDAWAAQMAGDYLVPDPDAET